MSASITVLCYKYKTLSNGKHPLMLRIHKDGKRKLVSLNISVFASDWNFDKNQPKRNCPHRDAILRLITEKTKEYQDQLIELKIENNETN